MNSAQSAHLINGIDKLGRSKTALFLTFGMLLSCFYNLPIAKYSLLGNNELRLFDFLGLFLIFFTINNYRILFSYLKFKTELKLLYNFLLWCNFTLIFTIAFSSIFDRPIMSLRSALYLYHFWTFFLFGLLLSIYLRDKKRYLLLTYFFLVLVIAHSFVVILQNMKIIPFLWGSVYEKAYDGFSSGTLGPNKIVLGMTMLMSFVLTIGLFFNQKVKVNKILLITSIALCLISILISGSRTTYVGLIVFVLYFLINRPSSFFLIGIFISILTSIGVFYSLDVFETIIDVVSGRVIDKLSAPDQAILDDTPYALKAYEDLGSGRIQLSRFYLRYLFSNPILIPFGAGFTNRIMIVSSAHNIYLSLISEVGVLGLFLYLRWLLSYLKLKLMTTPFLKMCLTGLTLSMLVTLFFGEHLYVYRPLFALVAMFLFSTTMLTAPNNYPNGSPVRKK